MSNKEALTFRDCVYYKQNLFFFSENTNLSVRLSLQGGEDIIFPYNCQIISCDLEICVGNVVYVLEVSGKYMMQYDLNTHSCGFVQIDCGCNADGNFAFLSSHDNKVSIFTRDQGELVIYDIIGDTIERVQYPNANSNYYITGCLFGDKCLIFPKNGKDVLEYSVIHNTWKVHSLNYDLVNCVHAIAENERIYVLLASGKILVWNYNLQEIEKIINVEEFYGTSLTASRLCLTNEKIIVLPSTAQDIIVINRINGQTSIYADYPEDFGYDLNKKNWSKYYGYCENDTEYYFACRTSKYILKIEKKNGKISWIKSEIDKFQAYLARNKNFVYESSGDLELFIGLKNQKNVENTEKWNNGGRIWKVSK